MHPEYLPQGFDGCLTHLMEECAEVIVQAAKIQRFGVSSYNPLTPHEDNLGAIYRELDDLKQAIERFECTLP